MKGRTQLLTMIPPKKKSAVAISDGHCKVDSPKIPCPDVQPPAYLVPKPTRKPPIIIRINPLSDSKLEKLNRLSGI